MSSIREALERATEYLREHPADAVSTDTRATAVVQSGLRVSVTGPGNESVVTDMVQSVGGEGSAPSPGWLLRAGMASCVATLLAMRAAQLGQTLDRVEVEVDSVSDDRGILGIDASTPSGPLSVRVAIRVAAPSIERAQLEALVAWAVDHCPVVDAARRAVPVNLEFDAT
jgi:uncharacterized OsmC-like protein